MVEKRKPMPVAEAVQAVMNVGGNEAKKETIPLANSYRRILAEDLVADHDVPSFDRSPYDGFAIRAADSAGANRNRPIYFRVAGEIGAGEVFPREVQEGEAVRIMTGAQIPDGCDAVVMLELIDENSEEIIAIKRAFSPGDNISFQGEDTEKGARLVPKGTSIDPGVIALLATFGYAEVPVAIRPRVGIIATGSELLEVHEPLEPGKIRNSNAYMMAAQVERAGGEPVLLGKLPDDLDACIEAVSRALQDVDMLITTGGASVGDYDYVPDIIEHLGGHPLFNKVAMRPGSVTTVADIDKKLFFGLSGNPSACFVGFELFVRPVLRRSLFSEKPHLKRTKATLGKDYPKPNPFTRFVRATLEEDDGRFVAKPGGLDKSGSVTSIAGADVLIALPGGSRGYEAGMDVDIFLLEDHKGSEWPWDSSVASYKS
ncbi:molybdopterin molybdotransferase MoeA [Salicibibacter cibarius]|uniref:Molybdopterin molybdenumtransferase n=1 Tax=Salicibibacter cibarius TaxID=2743000 RepID=A0A7T7CAC4_9BACI|nr:gephyrin-like molybdotransferase Glp [Salicibibacter cibarius]QQK74744.1 molybdopterin molybdotransferase MoeA [Salicibibacter cibarius]